MELLDYVINKKLTGGTGGSGGGGSDEEWFNDGDTHIWISLPEGRTSPVLGVCPKGTVTVDWGDGTTPDTLTGTSTTMQKWTPSHEYASAGEYVIRLTCDGEFRLAGATSSGTYAYILRHSGASDTRNATYLLAVKKVEFGRNVASIGANAFYNCYSLASIDIPDSVKSIENSAFYSCYSLASIDIPDGVTSIGNSAFNSCYSLASIVMPDGVTSIGNSAFYRCVSLASIVMPDSVTIIDSSAFYNCHSLVSVVMPASLTSIGSSAFYNCAGIRFYDFTRHTAVPTLSNTNAFTGIPTDCEIRVPAALYDEWIAATNWATYASNIVAV